jgi:hypothetical protein
MWVAIVLRASKDGGFEARSDVASVGATARAGARRETAQAVSRLTVG